MLALLFTVSSDTKFFRTDDAAFACILFELENNETVKFSYFVLNFCDPVRIFRKFYALLHSKWTEYGNPKLKVTGFSELKFPELCSIF